MDPVGSDPEWGHVITIYTKSVMLDVSHRNKSSVRLTSYARYALAVERLFTLGKSQAL